MSEKLVTKMQPPQFILDRQPNVFREEEKLAKESKVAARVTELCDINTRRGLEVIARDMGFEPTKAEFPDKVSLATAIAEKEIPEEAPAEEVAEHIVEETVEEEVKEPTEEEAPAEEVVPEEPTT